MARMQSVVDLGRILRDRKTMPIKYPLPEVVVIHKDLQCLDDIRSLENYILEELNIKSVTLSSDKASYGVTLRAEPDHKTLGLRLKGAFKPVMAEIKQLDDKVLTSFLDGEKLNIQGHDIQKEDLRIMYSFSGEKSKELSEKYEADSSGDILVMLDTTPDEEMLEEGVAREVINRIQKLRKSSGLKVDDKVTMYYSITPKDHKLTKIVSKFSDYIETSSRTPIRSSESSAAEINREAYELKGAKLELVVRKGFPPGYSTGSPGPAGVVPLVPWVNLCLLGSPSPYIGSNMAGLLLPTSSPLTITSLTEYAQDVFGLYNVKIDLFLTPDRSTRLENVSNLDGSTVYVSKLNNAACDAPIANGFNCKFFNLDTGGTKSSILLENPQGKALPSITSLKNVCKGKKLKLFSDNEKKKEVPLCNLEKFAGQTLYM